MNLLDRLLAGVSEATTIPESVSRFVHNVGDVVGGSAGNEGAIGSIADMLHREATRIGGHVVANTPMISATPPVHPVPARDGGDLVPITGTKEEVQAWMTAHPNHQAVYGIERSTDVHTIYFADVGDDNRSYAISDPRAWDRPDPEAELTDAERQKLADDQAEKLRGEGAQGATEAKGE